MATKQTWLRGFEAASVVAGVVTTVFAVFWFLDERHAHQENANRTYIEVQAKINAMEMRQFAAAKKYYEDKKMAGMTLDVAEQARLDFLSRQIERNEEAAEELDQALQQLKH